jgi:hypothetical protein
MRPGRAALVWLVASLLLSACQSTLPVSTPPVEVAPAATSAVTEPPTTPPPNVAERFAAEAGGLESGTMQVDGSATVGPVQMRLAGTSTFAGPDRAGTLTTTTAGVATSVESVRVAGKRYARTDLGPWLRMPSTTGTDLAGALARAAGGPVRDAGAEQRNGQTVHKLASSDASTFDPGALLGDSFGAEQVTTEIAFYATEAGLPVGATIDASWTQAVGGVSVAGSMSLDITLTSLGSHPSIRAPDDAWVVYPSKRFAYSIAHPENFTFARETLIDRFRSSAFAGIGVERRSASGRSLSSWGKSVLAHLEYEYHARTGTSEGATLAGVPARLLTVTGRDAAGHKVIAYWVLAKRGTYLYVVCWISSVGQEARDLATFRLVLGTFAFT